MNRVLRIIVCIIASFAVVTGVGIALGKGIFYIGEKIDSDIDLSNYDDDYDYGKSALVISLDKAELNVVVGDSLEVETESPYITHYTDGNRLVVKELRTDFKDKGRYIVTVTVPKDMVFETGYISAGTNKMNFERLEIRNLFLYLDTGNVNFDYLVVKNQLDVEGDFGRLTVKDGYLNNFDCELEEAEITMRTFLMGDADVDIEKGYLKYDILHTESDTDNHVFDVSKGTGTVNIDGVEVEDGKVHEGDNTFDIEVYEANCEITFSVGEMPLIENNKVEDDTKSNV